jgi:hypothetical protein
VELESDYPENELPSLYYGVSRKRLICCGKWHHTDLANLVHLSNLMKEP